MNFIHSLATVIFYEVLITPYLAEQNNTAPHDTKMSKTSALLKVIIQKFTQPANTYQKPWAERTEPPFH